MDSEKLRQINRDKADKVLSDKRHQDLLVSSVNVQNTVLSAVEALIKYLEGHTSKTQVVNQLKHVGTPDAFKVISAIDNLHGTLKTHKNVDLTDMTKVMQEVLEEAKKIPKELPKQEKQSLVDYTKRFEALEETIKTVERAVKAQKTTVEAPIVNIPETKVNVPPPDLKPVQTALKEVLGATKANKLPLLGDAVKTHQMNILVSEEFDEWKLVYDEFDDDDDLPVASNYYLRGKKVATVTYTYDDNRRPVGAKKS